MSQLLLSSFIILLSIPQTKSATWVDDDRISFDGDQGWAFYDKVTPDTDRCLTTTCQVSDATTTFYGPINNAFLILQRTFACKYNSDVSIKYNVAACGNLPGISNKDWTRIQLDGDQSSKVTIDSNTIIASTALDTSLCSNNNGYFTQTLNVDSGFDNSVSSNQTFETQIRIKVDGGNVDNAYIYGIEITCTPNGNTPAPTPQPIVSGTTSGTYCVGGFTGADAIYNGEYSTREEQPYLNSEFSYEKNDYNGQSFLYYNQRWYISTALDATGTDSAIVAKCVESSATQPPDDCHQGVVDGDGNAITLEWTDGECKNDHTTIEYLFGLFELNEETETLIMLITLCLFSYIAGMLTCACWRVICNDRNDKKKLYEKVSNKEADIEFSN